MSRYRKISVGMYADAGYRSLSKPQPNGQSLWVWLITGPMTTQIPGVVISGPRAMSERIGWDEQGFLKAFQEVIDEGMAEADFEAHLVWLPKAIFHNQPQSPNVVKSWGKVWSEIPECGLKTKLRAELRQAIKPASLSGNPRYIVPGPTRT